MRNANTLIYEKKKISVKVQAFATVLAIAGAVTVPYAFHAAGAALGLGSSLGAAFLPMHIPVILAAFLAGPLVGAAAGLMGPAAAYLISGMPELSLLPFMMIELCAYGICAGLLMNVKAPDIVKLLIVMTAGRLVKAAAILIAVYVLGIETIGLSNVVLSIKEGCPGIILQLILIPIILRITGNMKHEN